LTLTFLLFSCSTKQNNKREIYYVVQHPKVITKDLGNDPPPPLPPTTFYGNFNFILLDSSTIYFHNQEKYRLCGTGINDSRPPRVFLTPDNLTKINIDDLPNFLMSSTTDSLLAKDRHFFASISSPTDTIYNRAFKIITDFFKTKKIRNYYIRNWTEEEKYVTTAKIKNIAYKPELVDWKVGFENTSE
jgi:hypothetical protein